MSELDLIGVQQMYEAAESFTYAYKQYQLHPGAGLRRASALAALSTLEQAVLNHVSRETSKFEEKLDGDQEPPF